MTAKDLVGGSGTVVVECTDESGKPSKLSFGIGPLSMAQELALESELKTLVKSERDETRTKQLTDIGAVENPTWVHNQFISELVAYVMAPVNGLEVGQARFSLAGVRAELYHRAAPTNSKLERGHVAAVVTLENYGDIRTQLNQILATRKPQTPSKS